MLPLRLKGARTHNLQGIDLELEPGQVVAITGVSGAGKSSLALDTLYAEGQRRFVESFSPYARQFLERLQRPPMDSLEPAPAAVAVDRAAPVKSSRSTVATMADLEPLLAALFLREAWPLCPEHRVPGVERDVPGTADELVQEHPGQAAILSYRLRVPSSESYLQLRDGLATAGYRRVWFENAAKSIDELRPSDVAKVGHLDVVTDRVTLAVSGQRRLRESIEQTWRLGDGELRVQFAGEASSGRVLRAGFSCPTCARALSNPSAGLFSYESPVGACSECRGFGRVIGVDLNKVIPDPYKSLAQRAIRPWNGKSTTWERSQLKKMCERHGIPMDVPWVSLPEAQRQLVLQGDGGSKRTGYWGVLGWFKWLETKIYKMHVRVLLSRYRSFDECPSCRGARLNRTALAYTVGGWDLAAWHGASVSDVLARVEALELRTEQAKLIVAQLKDRLRYLERVGLGYLSLDRQARTLSGGEAQRVTLTAALGSSLHNALFVLDEPSVGLHPTDIAPLALAISELASRNNTVLVIEHDPLLIAAADRVVELGPGAGTRGGQIAFDGTVAQAIKARGATARALQASGRVPERAATEVSRQPEVIRLRGVRTHNLRGVDVDFPVGQICAVTGPSGSGKSSLVVDVLQRALARRLGDFTGELPGEFDELVVPPSVHAVVLVDQAPLGRTSRGNAATYTKAWDPIRKAFADEPSAKQRGLTASHFSFNVEGGRCDACAGEGYETVEMQFLADVRLLCPVCQGQRFKPAVLAVTHDGMSVAELLDSTVDRVLEVFASTPAVLRALGPVAKLGLGYLKLGQPLSTLSGGEAQRLKLARVLSEKLAGTVFIVDEPSAGLHADEVAHVIQCFESIVKGGGSVITVEHDLQIVRAADWIIDVGPGAGANGGQVVATGTLQDLAGADTRTGAALRAKAPKAGKATRRATASPTLEVRRAREHNLREVSVDLPHGALTVVTGPSGSGKSSLVFDVLFAEGQRRFLETLTPYARRFLPTLPKPDVDSVAGVPPSIALEQRTARAGANSTVATVTEVAHYLRLLFAKLGVPHCPTHALPIGSTNVVALLDRIQNTKGKWQLLAPVVEARKGTYLDVFNAADRDGIAEAYCDGQLVETANPPRLVRSREHSIELVLSAEQSQAKLSRAELERALTWGKDSVILKNGAGQSQRHSLSSSCPECGFSVPELDPRWFSFNTKQGQCPTCEGKGSVEVVAKRRSKRPAKRASKEAASAEAAPSVGVCPDCGGTRLAAIPRATRLQGRSYPEFDSLSVAAFAKAASALRFSGDAATIAAPIVVELVRRIEFLQRVGLGYLTLGRSAQTLSGGEMQRLRLAAQLGAGLTGALYVLDEPTIGLHARDTQLLIDNLKQLVAIGSTVVVVEHDADMIRAADHLVDMGPGGGVRGGRVMAEGTPGAVLSHPDSPTARCLGQRQALRSSLGVTKDHPMLALSGVQHHNVDGADVQFAVGRFNVVAGVSGSGKSSLVRGVLLPAVRAQLGLVTEPPGHFERLGPLHGIARAISVDQSPIGRTPRSVPATFLGIWDELRKLFARTPEAQVRGYGPARFSFNTPSGGRCAGCDGQGVVTHEMSFLPDVIQVCPVCQGKRFDTDTCGVHYLGLDIGQVLQLSVDEACEVFASHPKLVAPLRTLADLGAGYIRLGQGSHTLSGGESQRLKLAAELTAGTRHEPTLYVLDEPTTGLHQGDVEKLVAVLDRLVARGDTLVVIEHHPVLIAGADYIVELGPEGGERGGKVVAAGSAAQLSRRKTATAGVIAGLLGASA